MSGQMGDIEDGIDGKTGIEKHVALVNHVLEMRDKSDGEIEIYIASIMQPGLKLSTVEVRAIKKDVMAQRKQEERANREKEKIKQLNDRKEDAIKDENSKAMRKLNRVIESEQRKQEDAEGVINNINDMQDRAPIFFDENRMSWMWSNEATIYNRVDDTDILLSAKDVFGYDIYEGKEKSEVLELVRQSGRARGIEPPEKTVVVFKGGAVNICTGETFTPAPDKLYTSFIPHRIGIDDETPTFDRIFREWAGEKYMTLYEILAYCMLDDYPLHRIFPLTGTGRNGKGEFLRLISAFIGDDNAQSTDLTKLADSRFETAKLYKKKVALIAETDDSVQMKTSTIKMLTGGDKIGCEFKGIDGFSFTNTAKIIIATNSLPDTKDKTDGFYRRFLITSFDNEFEEKGSVIDKISELEYENLTKKCIGILKRLLETGFTHDGTVDEKRELYEQKANPVGTFLTNSCNVDDAGKIPLWYLHELYGEFASDHGHAKMPLADFKKNLSRNFALSMTSAYHSKDEKLLYKIGEIAEGGKWQIVNGIVLKKIMPI
ncbi:MAG: hypothetical protein KAJ03_11630 [Gammaproteobacteria bacterium]|nr:hypothetical protein [Gammaproteobacteria bacterium]